MIKRFLQHNYIIFLVYLCLIGFVGYVLLHHDKSDLHVIINSVVGNPFADQFFSYLTYVGDGLFVIILALVIIMTYSIRKGLLVIFSYAFASLFTTILKRCFYDDVNRPYFVFTYFRHQQLKYVSGVENLIHNSFPSGHSTAAFALFFSLIFTTNRYSLKWFYFILAVLVAFSRTYLSQHWLIDIYVGSVIGVCFSILIYLLLYHRSFMQKLDKPLIRSLKK